MQKETEKGDNAWILLRLGSGHLARRSFNIDGMCDMLAAEAGDDAGTATEGQTRPEPVEHHGNPVPQSDQESQMDDPPQPLGGLHFPSGCHITVAERFIAGSC